MAKFKSLTGNTFGNLKAVFLYGKNKQGRSMWACQCACGSEAVVEASKLINGHTKSCGCYRDGKTRERRTSHGLTAAGSEYRYMYNTYHRAKGRCENKNNYSYSYYGGRGIEFRFTSVEQLALEVGPKPTPEHSIDRIDNDGHYEPGNVRWASKSTQCFNRRSSRLSNTREPITLGKSSGISLPPDTLTALYS